MSPAAVLTITFAASAVGLFAFFLGTAIFLQPNLYEAMTNRLPLRAAIAGLLVAGFLTAWTFVNTRAESKDRYGTLFEFNPTQSREISEFTAVRTSPGRPEVKVKFKKQGNRFVEAAEPTKTFTLTTADYMTSSIEVPIEGTAVRFDAEMDAKGKYKSGSTKLFNESNGRRYFEVGQSNLPSSLFSPSRGAFILALGLNGLHFVIWLIALWPVLQYTLGHALLGAGGLGLFVMLLLMPLLFDKNRVPEGLKQPAPAAVPAGATP